MADFKAQSFIIALADISKNKIQEGAWHKDRFAWNKPEDTPGEIWWNDAEQFHALVRTYGEKYGVTEEDIIEGPDLEVRNIHGNSWSIGFISNAFNHPQPPLSRRIAQAELLVSVITKSIHGPQYSI
jgi:hypothetical protein